MPFEGKERLDDLIRDIPEFSQAGITSMETLVLNETLDEDQEEALWAAINDAISLRLYEDPARGSQLITDALELSYWSDYVETYKDEVLDPPVGCYDFLSALNRRLCGLVCRYCLGQPDR